VGSPEMTDFVLQGRLARLRVVCFPEEREWRQQTMHCRTGAAAANIVSESAEPRRMLFRAVSREP
jgi:hypothetical protein